VDEIPVYGSPWYPRLPATFACPFLVKQTSGSGMGQVWRTMGHPHTKIFGVGVNHCGFSNMFTGFCIKW